MKTTIQIILILLAQSSECVLFETPVIVKNEQESIFECWGCAVNNGVWLMDESGEWHEWEEGTRNAELVINSVHERLKDLQLKAA